VRPDRIVVVCGTGTEVGKTWVGARLLADLRSGGRTVAARKPAQSFDVDRHGERLGGATDAEILAGATGEHPDEVCRSFRSYHRAMAPPIAAEALGLPAFTVADLVGELGWPTGPTDVGLVETAGGIRSPQADDGDVCDLVAALGPDLLLVVADAGLGTINSIRMSVDALAGARGATPEVPVAVVLNRYDGNHEIHRRNRAWLESRDGFVMVALPGGDSMLAELVLGA
jgi:dethiobiotin synthetase